MALPSPTSVVSFGVTLTNSDIVSGAQFINHILPPIVFKALEVQYFGYVNMPVGGGFSFSPQSPVTTFAAVLVRNLGGQGSGNVSVTVTPTSGPAAYVVNLDIGAIFLYISPLLSSVLVNAIAPGIATVTLASSATTSSNLEVLVAG
jgi:hypothetical protein